MVLHGTVTLAGTGTRVNMATAVGEDFNVRWLTVQPDALNVGVVYLGGLGLTTNSFGFRFEAPVAQIPSAPWQLDGFESGSMKLSDLSAIGTNNDLLHVCWSPYD